MVRNPKKSRAFSLVELLVVVSIIAVLISILVPALSKARQVTRATTCASNLRQIGMTLSVYIQNNDDRIPQDNPSNNPFGKWFGLVGYKTGVAATSFAVENRALYGLIDSQKVATCPMDNETGAVDGVIESVHNTWGTSYTLNTNATSPNFSHAVRRFSAVVNPSLTILAGDTTMYSMSGTTWPCSSRSFSWHSSNARTSNILFFDMHVAPTVINLAASPDNVAGDYKWAANQ